ARYARQQAAIFTTHAAGMGVFATLARPPGAGRAQCLVHLPRPLVKLDLSAPRQNPPMVEASATTTAPKRAMVLAAGLGTRMRAFNGTLPKPLVQVGGKALIDYVLDRLAEQRVEQAVVNVHHLAD